MYQRYQYWWRRQSLMEVTHNLWHTQTTTYKITGSLFSISNRSSVLMILIYCDHCTIAHWMHWWCTQANGATLLLTIFLFCKCPNYVITKQSSGFKEINKSLLNVTKHVLLCNTLIIVMTEGTLNALKWDIIFFKDVRVFPFIFWCTEHLHEFLVCRPVYFLRQDWCVRQILHFKHRVSLESKILQRCNKCTSF